MLVWEVLKRWASALRVFINKVLSILQLPILRDLGEVIKIYKAGYNTEIIWDYGIVLLIAPGRDYTRKTEIVEQENKDRDRAQLEIP